MERATEAAGAVAPGAPLWSLSGGRGRQVGRRRDGSVVPMLVSGARFAMDRRDYLVINARDVSDAERARLEREAILENASIGTM